MLKEWSNKTTNSPFSSLFTQANGANTSSQNQMNQSLLGSKVSGGLFNNMLPVSTSNLNQTQNLLIAPASTLGTQPFFGLTNGNSLFQNMGVAKDKPAGSLFPALGTSSNSLISGLDSQNQRQQGNSNLLQGLNQLNPTNQASGVFSNIQFNQNKEANPTSLLAGLGTQNNRTNSIFNQQSYSSGVKTNSLFQNLQANSSSGASNLLTNPTQSWQTLGISNPQKESNWLGMPLNSNIMKDEKSSILSDMKPNSSLFTQNMLQRPTTQTNPSGTVVSATNSQSLLTPLQQNNQLIQNQQYYMAPNSSATNNRQTGPFNPAMATNFQQNSIEAMEKLTLALTQFVSLQQNQAMQAQVQEAPENTTVEDEQTYSLRSLAGYEAEKFDNRYDYKPYSIFSEEPKLGSSFNTNTLLNFNRNERRHKKSYLPHSYPNERSKIIKQTTSRRNDENLTFLFKRNSSEEYEQTHQIRKVTNATFVEGRSKQAVLKETEIDSNKRDVEKTKPFESVQSVPARILASEEKIPILTKAGYTIVPCLFKLSRMTEEELSAVENFTISNEFGTIAFEEPVDLRGLNLDRIVNIKYQEAEIYPEDYKLSLNEGDGLNKPATITFFKWEVPKKYLNQLEKYEGKLKNWCATINAEFLSFNPESQEVKIHLKKI